MSRSSPIHFVSYFTIQTQIFYLTWHRFFQLFLITHEFVGLRRFHIRYVEWKKKKTSQRINTHRKMRRWWQMNHFYVLVYNYIVALFITCDLQHINFSDMKCTTVNKKLKKNNMHPCWLVWISLTLLLLVSFHFFFFVDMANQWLESHSFFIANTYFDKINFINLRLFLWWKSLKIPEFSKPSQKRINYINRRFVLIQVLLLEIFLFFLSRACLFLH